VTALVVRELRPEGVVAALDLLHAVAADPEGRFFTPHPFTKEVLSGLATTPGRDLYYLLMSGDRALAYGLLRGWNEGHVVPSLGLAVAPAARKQGLGRTMMDFLHGAARHRGATRVRLRVHPENVKAMALYRSMGYMFESPDPVTGLLVGLKDLSAS
jgi:ribosomal protein S18 acetylase RimI-like enzyme